MDAPTTPGRGGVRTSTLLLLVAVGLVAAGGVTSLTLGSPQAAPPAQPSPTAASATATPTPAASGTEPTTRPRSSHSARSGAHGRPGASGHGISPPRPPGTSGTSDAALSQTPTTSVPGRPAPDGSVHVSLWC